MESQPNQPLVNSRSARDTSSRITRSRTGSLPPGSRNNSVFNNLAQGLPARPSSKTAPSSRQVAKVGKDTLSQHQQHSTVHQLDLLELDKIQNVCQAESQPLREEISALREQINAQHQQTSTGTRQDNPELLAMRRENEVLRSQQRAQMDTLNQALEPLAQLKNVIDDVVLLRRDTNALLEAQANPPRDTPGEDFNDNSVRKAIGAMQQKSKGLEIPQIPQQQFQQSRVMPVHLEVPQEKAHHVGSNQHANSDDDNHLGYPSNQHAYTDDSDDETTDKIAFYNREKGPRHPRLMVIRPADPIFDRLLNYRYYRLLRLDTRRDTRTMLDTSTRIKALQLTMSDSKFSGSDPILIFDFLTRLTEEADINQMTEGQALIALPYFLCGTAESNFRATRRGARTQGVNTWPEAVQHLLSTYATPAAIRQAVQEVHDTKQKSEEDELQYSNRLNYSVYRCGNVYTEMEKMTFFVNGLRPETQAVVARYRESTPRDQLRYERLVQFARDEGTTHRARMGISKPSQLRSTKERNTRGSVHFLDPNTTSDTLDDQEQVHLINQVMGGTPHDLPTSVATSELPSTIDFHDQDTLGQNSEQLYYTSQVKPSRIPYGDRRSNLSKAGWVSQQPLICYHCYEKNTHVAPECDKTRNELPVIIRNYESLTDEERSIVPKTAYSMAKQFLKSDGIPHPPNTQPTGDTSSKN